MKNRASSNCQPPSSAELEVLSELLQTPGDAARWHALGRWFLQTGRPQQALGALRLAHDFEPKNSTIHPELIEACLASGCSRQAAEVLAAFERLDYEEHFNATFVQELKVRVQQAASAPMRLALESLPRISVGIPTRERPESITKLVESLRRQTFTNFELIISDDSREEGLQQHIEAAFPGLPFHYIRGPRVNAPANRQNIIRNASCPLLVIIDDDHVLEPQCLELLVRTALENPFCGLVSAIWPDLGKKPLVLDQGQSEFLDTCSASISSLHGEGYPWWRQGQWTFCSLYDPGTPFSAMTTGGGCVLYRREFLSLIGGLPGGLSTVSFRDDASISYLMYLWGFTPLVQPRAIAYHDRCSTGGTRDTTAWDMGLAKDALRFMRSIEGWRDAAARRRALLMHGKLSARNPAGGISTLPAAMQDALHQAVNFCSAPGESVDVVICADENDLRAVRGSPVWPPVVLAGEKALLDYAEKLGIRVAGAIYSDACARNSPASEVYSLYWEQIAQAAAGSLVPQVPLGMSDESMTLEVFLLRAFLAESLRRSAFPTPQVPDATDEDALEQALLVRNRIHGGRALIPYLYQRPPESYSPFLSILIPLSKESGGREQLLTSLLGQTFTNFEVIVVKSPDESSGTWSTSPKVRIVEDNAQSDGERLSAALPHIRGRWVLWIDAEDLVSNALESAVRTVSEAPSERCFLFVDERFGNDAAKHFLGTPGEFQVLSLLRGHSLSGIMPLVRTHVLSEARGFKDYALSAATFDFMLRSSAYFLWECRKGTFFASHSATLESCQEDQELACAVNALDFINEHDLTRCFPFLFFTEPEHVICVYSVLFQEIFSSSFSPLLDPREALLARAVEWMTTQADEATRVQFDARVLAPLRASVNQQQLPVSLKLLFEQLTPSQPSRLWYQPVHPYRILNRVLREGRLSQDSGDRIRGFLVRRRQHRNEIAAKPATQIVEVGMHEGGGTIALEDSSVMPPRPEARR